MGASNTETTISSNTLDNNLKKPPNPLRARWTTTSTMARNFGKNNSAMVLTTRVMAHVGRHSGHKGKGLSRPSGK